MKLDPNFDWKTYSWLKRGPRRVNVLKYINDSEKPQTATDVKKNQKVDITQAAFTLSELNEKELVGCLNSEDHHGKLFVITKKGKDMLEKLSL